MIPWQEGGSDYCAHRKQKGSVPPCVNPPSSHSHENIHFARSARAIMCRRIFRRCRRAIGHVGSGLALAALISQCH